MSDMRLRFPPSPTGKIHVGNIRTALFNYLLAEKHDGELILRIEDTDMERSTREFEDIIIKEMDWLGIEATEGVGLGGENGPYRQSERRDIYDEYIEKLLDEDKAYRCYCSEEELQQMREEQKARGEIPHYDGRCREGDISEEKKQRDYAVRFKMPRDEQEIVVEDLVRGSVSFSSDEFNDFVIQKSNGYPTYNFAVVVDDALMEVTHVMRGEDHLSNTPKQIMLYRAMGFSLPYFAHLPLILSRDGSKLKKRSDKEAVYVGEFREKGYLPEAMINFLALLGWSPPHEEEILSREELIDLFAVEDVNRSGAVFDREKLNWMNNHYIKNADLDRLVELSRPYLEEAGFIDEDTGEKWLKKLLDLIRDGVEYLAQLPDECEIFFRELEYEDKAQAREMFADADVQKVLSAMLEEISGKQELQTGEVSEIFSRVQENTGVGGRKFYHPLRYALTGQESGPDLAEFMVILGPEEISARLEKAMETGAAD